MLYFIPNASSISEPHIRSIGLDYLKLDGAFRVVNNGPGGHNGIVVQVAGCESSLGYYREIQVWSPAPQGDAESPPFWCGFDKDKVPGPEKLAREEMIPGTWVEFRNGTKWLIPKLRSWHLGEPGQRPVVYRVELPCLLSMDRYGNVGLGKVLPEHEEIFAAGTRIHDAMTGKANDCTDQEWFRFAADLITMNYSIGLFELMSDLTGHLQLADVQQVIRAGIDWDGFMEALGNAAGRLERPTTDTDSGSEPSTLDEPTTTYPQLVS